MDSHHAQARLLRVLAHPTRLRLLGALRRGEECVCHLTAVVGQRQAYVSQQLMFLRQAGLLADRKEGSRVYYRIKDKAILRVLDAVGAIAGADGAGQGAQALVDCPCPRCAGLGAGHRRRSNSSGRRPSRRRSARTSSIDLEETASPQPVRSASKGRS